MQLRIDTTVIKLGRHELTKDRMAFEVYDLLRGALGNDVYDRTVRVHDYKSSVTVTVCNHMLPLVVDVLSRSEYLARGELDPKPQHPWLK